MDSKNHGKDEIKSIESVGERDSWGKVLEFSVSVPDVR